MSEELNINKHFDNYVEKLVDLSARNRLLKYPERALRIRFLPDVEQLRGLGVEYKDFSICWPEVEIRKRGEQLDLMHDVEIQGDKDVKLLEQVDISGEKLIKQLTTLRRDQRRLLEEHGVHSLYLAVGSISWSEELEGKSKNFYAPLLLVPIEITRETKGAVKWHIGPSDGHEIEVNLALRLYLKRKQKGVNSDILDPATMGLDEIADFFVKAFREVGLTAAYKAEAFIGQFLFGGQHMHEDLVKNQKEFLGNEFVRGICGDGNVLSVDNMPSVEHSDDPDRLLALEEDYSVLSADPSQLKVVSMGIDKRSFVVQGPPGTGKSQTIVNLLTNLAARGKKVLFVCEKRVAMEVVYKRLRDQDLAAICFPVFELNRNSKVNLAKVACDDAARVSSLIRNLDRVNRLLLDRDELRSILTSHAQILNEPTQPLGKTLYWVYNQLAQVVDKKRTAVKWDYEQFDPFIKSNDDFNRISVLFNSISPALIHKAYKDDVRFNWFSSVLEEAYRSECIDQIKEIQKDFIKICDTLPLARYNKISNFFEFVENKEKLPDFSNFSTKVSDVFLLRDGLGECVNLICAYTKLAEANPYALLLARAAWSGSNFKLEEKIANLKLNDLILACESGRKIVSEQKRSFKLITKDPLFLKERSEIEKISRLIKLDLGLLINLPKGFNLTSAKIVESFIDKIKIISERRNTVQHNIATSWGFDINLLPAASIFQNNLDIATSPFFLVFVYLLPKYRSVYKFFKGLCLFGDRAPIGIFQLAGQLREYLNLNIEINSLREQTMHYLDTNMLDEERALEMINEFKKWVTVTNLEDLDHSKLKNAEQIFADRGLVSAVSDAIDLCTWRDLFALTLQETGKDLDNIRETVVDSLQIYESLGTVYEKLTGLEKVDGYLSERTVKDLLFDIGMRDELCKFVVDFDKKISEISDQYFDLHSNEHRNRIVSAHDVLSGIIVLLDEYQIEYKTAALDEILKTLRHIHSNEVGRDFSLFNERFEKFISDYRAHLLNELDANSLFDVLNSVTEDVDGFSRWLDYKYLIQKADNEGVGWLVVRLAELDPDIFTCSFIHSYWCAWLTSAKRSGLDIPSPTDLKKNSLKFAELDRKVLELNYARVLMSVCKSDGYTVPSALLRREAAKRRQLKPLRALLSEPATCIYLQKAKPIWIMSPSAVSASLGNIGINFDCVVFDESSQLRVENALPALARAKQVIAFGDEHQLPPTNFFFADTQEDDDEMAVYDDMLSSLSSVFYGRGRATLNFHYRSRFEELIAFSNYFVYENRLVTSPNPTQALDAVKFVHVPSGVFQNRINQIEAREVARICVELVNKYPEESLGVIAFSRDQEVAIRDAVQEEIKGSDLENILLDEERDCEQPFFIKNLENVQGDERDRIIFSVGYGPEKTGGKVAQRFGPINGVHGYRRLNVAVTRARIQMICVSSMKAEDVRIDDEETSRGRMMLRKFLEYAERGISSLDAQVDSQEVLETENEFEQTILNALVARGLDVRPQVGVSRYRIDLGIIHPNDPSRFILGVECDGAMYHSSYSARLNDRLRQEHLENLGWKIYRIWSSDWIVRPQQITDEIVALVKSLV